MAMISVSKTEGQGSIPCSPANSLTGRSSAWAEYLFRIQGAAGSNPADQTNYQDVAQGWSTGFGNRGSDVQIVPS
jgi:hypothetical protein